MINRLFFLVLIFLMSEVVFAEDESVLSARPEKISKLVLYFKRQEKLVWLAATPSELQLPKTGVFYPESISGGILTIGIDGNDFSVGVRGIAILVRGDEVVIDGRSMGGYKSAVVGFTNKIFMGEYMKTLD